MYNCHIHPLFQYKLWTITNEVIYQMSTEKLQNTSFHYHGVTRSYVTQPDVVLKASFPTLLLRYCSCECSFLPVLSKLLSVITRNSASIDRTSFISLPTVCFIDKRRTVSKKQMNVSRGASSLGILWFEWQKDNCGIASTYGVSVRVYEYVIRTVYLLYEWATQVYYLWFYDHIGWG